MAGNQKRFQKMMNQGHSAAWDQLWSEAAEYYRQALEEYPEHPMALNSLGLALFEMQEYNEAFQYYLKAAKNSPKDPVPLEKIARIYERQSRKPESIKTFMKAAELHLKSRDVEKAIQNWYQVLKLQPEHQQAHTKLAMVHERLGHHIKAVNEYLAIASLLQRGGEKEKALQVIDHALTIMPDSVDAQQAKMLVKTNQKLSPPVRPQIDTGPLSQERTPQLKAPSQKSIKEQGPVEEAKQRALEILAGLLFDQADEVNENVQQNSQGISALARGSANHSISDANKSQITLHLGQAIESQTQGQTDQAAEELERALEIGLNDPAVHFNLGLLNLEKDYKKALIHLQKSVVNPDFALASHLMIGELYQNEENYTEAASAYLRALSIADSTLAPPEIAEELQQIYEPIIEFQSRQGKEEELKSLCENIHSQLMRKDWRNYLSVARQQLPEQEVESPPLPLAEMLIETQGGQVVESLAHIRKLTNERKLRSAMEEAFQTLQDAPTYLPLHVQIGKILLREGHIQAATDKFLLVARLYSLRGDANQAINLLMSVTKATPMDVSIRNRLIDLLVDQGRLKEAIDEYLELANIHYQQAELEIARKHFANALELARAARAEHLTVVKILYKIADIDQQRLDWRQAVKIYDQICALEPEDSHARVQLVDLKFRLGSGKEAVAEVDKFISLLTGKANRREAIDFMGEIVAEHPSQPDLRNRLAELYIQDGQILEAVDQLDAIADDLMNANNRFGAISVIQKIIALDPPNVEAYRTALAQLRGK